MLNDMFDDRNTIHIVQLMKSTNKDELSIRYPAKQVYVQVCRSAKITYFWKNELDIAKLFVLPKIAVIIMQCASWVG